MRGIATTITTTTLRYPVQAFPHRYQVRASGAPEGRVVLRHDDLVPIESSPPIEFGGPGDAWSPEGLLVAAVADCFILTFRAVARASKLEWSSLRVRAEGTLERRDGVTAFTGFAIHAILGIDATDDESLARAALERAERGCLVSRSLKASVHLESELAITV
jgi:organic hydroperoxide reductase OsmC/OhrA